VDYAAVLANLKERVGRERLRVVVAANAAMVLLYWDIGRVVLDRQADEAGARRSSIASLAISARPSPT